MSDHKAVYVKGFHPGQPIPAAVRAGDLVVTGQIVACEPLTRAFAPDPVAQINQMFENLDATMKAAGGTLADVIKINVYVKDKAIREALNPIWIERFPTEATRPVRQTVESDGLAPAALLSCDAMALIRN